MLDQDILEGLNPEQIDAVKATEGPVLVLAGAGSGKTRVLVQRIAYLVGVCGISPEAILAVTFTNKAAGEMRERVQKILGPEAEDLWVSTFHSTCVRILRKDIGHLGRSRGFVIYDQSDSLGVVKQALKRHELDPKVHEPKRISWRIDQWKNAGILPAQALDSATDLDSQTSAEIYTTYQRLLAESNALDFNDLLLQTMLLFQQFPEVLAYYQDRWQYVLVDEYQDTNRVQYALVKLLSVSHENLCVVGDPDQSIYAWRGADIQNILDFERDYPEARVVKLERNYRSTQPILAGASAVIANNFQREDKKLWTDREGGDRIELYEANSERDEAQHVVRSILSASREKGRSYREFAIFYRTNAQSRPFEEEFLKYDVPYQVVGGMRFYDRAEIKDALAYLRLAINTADGAALRRVVNNPPRGIGKTTLEKAEALSIERGGSLFDGLRSFVDAGGRSAAKVSVFLQLVETLANEVAEKEPAEALALILNRTGYLRKLEQEATAEAEGRIENLRELLVGAEDFSADNAGIEDENRTSMELFLDQVSLVSDLDNYDDRDDRVALMTVHSAKGLEYPVVFLVGLEEGIFPHAASSRDDAGVEEERRLCYVGMTRAMETLTVTYATERRRYGSKFFGVPSRFLREIPSELVNLRGQHLGDGVEYEAADPPSSSSIDYSYGQWGGDEVPEIRRGLRVRHPVFGDGSVIAVSGQGASQKLRIRFDRVGVKTVLLKFANLEPL